MATSLVRVFSSPLRVRYRFLNPDAGAAFFVLTAAGNPTPDLLTDSFLDSPLRRLIDKTGLTTPTVISALFDSGEFHIDCGDSWGTSLGKIVTPLEISVLVGQAAGRPTFTVFAEETSECVVDFEFRHTILA